MKKRILSMFLAIVMVVGLVPGFAVTASAADDDWTYPASVPTLTWGGSGTEADPYTIDTAQELADLAYMVNEEENYYAGIYFKLTNDIDLNPGFTATADGFIGEGTPKQWIPIGEVMIDDNVTVPFCGIFNGDGHSIKGMYIAEESCTSDAAGLFEYVDVYDDNTPSGIKNLNVKNSYLYSDCDNHTSVHCTALGTIVALNCSTVENCHVSDTYLTLDCPRFGWFMGVGGIVSDNNSESSKVLDCTFNGGVTYIGNYSPSMAGIVASNSGYVAGCINYGDVNAETDRVGGIVGTNIASRQSGKTDYTYGVVENCKNYGDIYGQYKVGGIVGHSGFYNASASHAIVKNCINYGNVSGQSDSSIGGVIGLLTYATTIDCYNYGNVSNQSDPATSAATGGVIGETSMDGYELKNCWYLKNDSTNTGLALIGKDESTGTISNCGSVDHVPAYTITVSATPIEGGIVTGNGTYNQDATVTLNATANDGYNFVNWTENGYIVSTDTEYTFTATEDRNLTAVFEKISQIDNFTDKTAPYTGLPVTHTLPDGLEGVKSITYSYKGIDTTDYVESPNAPTKVGTYEVTAVFEMNPGYAAVENKTAALTITPKALTITANRQDISYGGSIVSAVDKVTVDGLVNGDALTAITLTASTTAVTTNGAITPANAVILNASDVDVTNCYAIKYENGLLTIGLVLDRTEVTAQPKLDYTEGDTLDLSDMAVTAHYTDGSSAKLTYTDVVVSIAHGTALTADENGITIAINYNGKTAVTDPLVVQQKQPDFNEDHWFVVLAMLYNQKFDITATATEGGAITPAGVSEVKYSKDITYTITPNDGYTIADVIVDGKSVGAVRVYTFDNVRKDHEITAIFTKIAWTNPYSDVTEHDWFYADIEYVTENGLMNGLPGDVFSPELAATRAMIVTILWRLEGEPIVESPVDFFDVPEKMWYTDAVNWASANGIVTGHGDGTFTPESSITREQLAAILHRYAVLKGSDDGITLPAVSQYTHSAWAENDVIWAEMKGLFDGIAVDMTDMTAAASRAETAAVLRRFCETFSDIMSDRD